MSAEVGPDGQPPRFDGAAWVSQDGRYWWNGAFNLLHQPFAGEGVSNAKIDSRTEIEFDYRRGST